MNNLKLSVPDLQRLPISRSHRKSLLFLLPARSVFRYRCPAHDSDPYPVHFYKAPNRRCTGKNYHAAFFHQLRYIHPFLLFLYGIINRQICNRNFFLFWISRISSWLPFLTRGIKIWLPSAQASPMQMQDVPHRTPLEPDLQKHHAVPVLLLYPLPKLRFLLWKIFGYRFFLFLTDQKAIYTRRRGKYHILIII